MVKEVKKFSSIRKLTFVEIALAVAIVVVVAAITIPFIYRANDNGQFTQWKSISKKIQLDVSLAAYFDFAERDSKILYNKAKKGKIDDIKKGAKDGKIVNSVEWKKGRWQLKWGVEFVADNSYIESEGNFQGETLTLIVWFQTKAADLGIINLQNILESKSQTQLTLAIKNGNIIGVVNKGILKSKNSYNDGEWHMAAIVVNTSTGDQVLSIDGKIEEQVKKSDLTPFSSNLLLIGQGQKSAGSKLGVDEVMVSLREYSAKELEEIYQGGKP